MARHPVLSILFGAATAVGLLALTEGTLALLGVPDPGLYEGDMAYLWVLRPHLDREVEGPAGPFRVRTNDLGLRGDPPPSGGPWTLALGCSTTFGWGVEVEEAWPAVLASLGDGPVVNGGQPGWSTEQALRGADRWLKLGPTRVILAYGVRDQDPAPRPDREVMPMPWTQRTHLFRLLHRVQGAVPAGDTFRVPPDRFGENLRELVGRVRAQRAEPVLLAFPRVEPREDWIRAMEGVGEPVLQPQLASTAFFSNDPIHLTPEGHRALAQALRGATAPTDPPPPPPAGPPGGSGP